MKFTEKRVQEALARFYDYRRNIIVPNVSFSFFNHECDLLVVAKAGHATEVEIKVSKADLKKDFEKRKHQRPRPQHISRLFYCVPTELLELAFEIVPIQYGILEVRHLPIVGNPDRALVFLKRAAKKEKGCRKFSEKEVAKLLHNLSIKFWTHKAYLYEGDPIPAN